MVKYDSKRFSKLGPQSDLYTRPNTRAEYQLFSNDYFTGSDVSFYMGDIWIDDIVDLEFSLVEQVMPVYGYASYTPDVFVKGNRIIQGAFTINFKSVGYINEVLRHKDPIKSLYNESNNNGLKSELVGNYNLEETLKLYGIKSFDELANRYEEELWKVSDGNEESVNRHRSYFSHYDNDDALDDGLEIKIAYGPREAIASRASDYNGKLVRPNDTIETLVGVQITGVQKGVYTSFGGAPITERYTFVARDLNGTVSLD